MFFSKKKNKSSIKEEPRTRAPTLTTILVGDGIVTREQVNLAYKKQITLTFRLKIGEVLVRLGFCTTSDVDTALQKQHEMRISENGIHEKNLEMVKSRICLLDKLMGDLDMITQEAQDIVKKPSGAQ